jgi:hypothetical protein
MSAIADPSQGLYVDAGGGDAYLLGGTSLAAPVITALYALTHERAGSNSGNSSVQADLYAAPYASGRLTDVTSGANYPSGLIASDCTFSSLTVQCAATNSWDGPTGLGTPNSPTDLYPLNTSWVPQSCVAPFTCGTSSSSSPIGGAGTAPAPVTVNNPGAVTSYTGVSTTIDIHATAPGASSVTYNVTGVPSGVTLSAAAGTVSGTPKHAGVYPVSVSVQTGTQSVGTTFVWTVKQNGYKPKAKPKIAGTAKRGKTLKVSALTWKTLAGVKAAPKVSYQWYLNGKTIKGATKASYKVPNKASYKKKTLTVKIAVKASTYFATYSAKTPATKKIS